MRPTLSFLHRRLRTSRTSKIPMADSLILATARLHDAELWTQDEDFRGLENVRYVAK